MCNISFTDFKTSKMHRADSHDKCPRAPRLRNPATDPSTEATAFHFSGVFYDFHASPRV